MKMKILLVTLQLVVFVAAELTFIKNTYPNPNSKEAFRHMIKDKATGYIYVAGVNKIIQLNENFTVLQSIGTGPRLDDPECLPHELNLCKAKKMTDNYSKALMIDDRGKRLIACSSLFQGSCKKYHLSDITKFDNDSSRNKYIVANNATATTVAFIAPGPTEDGQIVQPNVMYVGTTYTTSGSKLVRDDIPAFCSRNVNTFDLAHKGPFVSTSKFIDGYHRSTFFVNYIYGFSSDSFSYMATVQRASTAAEKYITKLIRVCQNDKSFYSYTEVELVCEHNGAKYNLLQAARKAKPGKLLAEALGINMSKDVLFATFSIGKAGSTDALNDTAVCIYQLETIKTIFTKNVRNCFDGVGNTGPDHIVGREPCQKAKGFIDRIDLNYCRELDINHPIDGLDPISARAALTLKTKVSAITVAVTHDYTIAFIGTQNGHIIKVAIESQELAHMYEDREIENGARIHEDMVFDMAENYLFVMTDKKIYKLALQDCSQYESCGECRGANDPFCGWCSLEDKCSVREQCESNESELRWLGYKGETCTNITSVYPDKLQKNNKVSRTTSLTLNISNLPTYEPFKIVCQFSGYNTVLLTKANRTSSNTMTCETPLPNQLPSFPVGEDHIIMKLSVVIDKRLFVSTNFTFFDCEVHSDDACYKCSLSKFNCTWCIKNHMCTYYPLQDCSETDEFVAALNSGGFLHKHTVGPDKCPRISKGHPEILVPSGNYKKVVLFAHNLRTFQYPIYCYFSIGSGRFVTARLISHTESEKIVECENTEFSYIENTQTWNVPFKITWGSKDLNKPFDNPGHVQVKMYKCEMMGNNCGSCLIIPTDYNCGWCDSRCSIQGDCRDSIWLHSSSTCPNPKIISINPVSGPKNGGTELTIIGENLGRTYADIVSYVDVAGISCSPLRDKYKPPSRIVCETGEYFEAFQQRGPVRVTVNGQYLAESKQIFSYVTPNITSLSPTQGAMSGGTEITITGQSMNAGTNISVYIDNTPCTLIKKTRDNVICETQASNKTKIGKLTMTFDFQSISSPLTFRYMEDPIIYIAKPLKTIKSGGMPVNVTGQRLHIIQNPRIVFWGENKETYEGDCYKGSTVQEMTCWTPYVAINFTHRRKRSEEQEKTPAIVLEYGFMLDNVKAYQKFGNFTVYPDPEFEAFSPSTKIFSGGRTNDFLTIGGKYLTDTGFVHNQVKVQIGKGECEVKSIQFLLSCKPPKNQPTALSGGQYPEVIISVGKNLTVTLGNLKYGENEIGLPTMYIILISAGGGLLLLVVIMVLCLYRVKSKKNDSMMKKMQNQMDNLELKVAKECKEAFAELQTDMTELTNDLYGQVSIPFWNYQTYCMRVLFPQDNTVDHPVIKDLEVDYNRRDSVEKGLALFSQLIGNKTFLLTFIRTLETHKNFSMKDKVNVASLISVALQTKMEYSTEILKTLLSDLIERSIDGRKEPKLLFRRNESVAEKMLTNWFTFLLYKFLKEVAGEPLFMLYLAMKQQVAKGPVDSATSEARYSLSEDKLIRQQIEYRQMTVYVQDMEQYQAAHPVKVLDCDTVSQVKEKILDAIYKNAPFSSRPIKDDVDLEWNSGTKGRLILQDDDNTTKQEGEYRRINTLLHYKVNDGAYMSLVPKQTVQFNQSSLNSSEKSGSKFYDNFPFSTRSPSLNRTVTPQNVALEMEIAGVNKFYHLVRPHESENFNKEGTDRGSKMVSEIYLTRLLATKGTLQQYVDDLFERIFSIAHRGNALPLAIKYMFDFLDDQALLHNIQDQEVVYTWKSNSLPLRFWVNVIKNPNFVFDIYKSNIVDSCLSVVAQTFMDSCSQSPHRLGKDSPSSKLLFAKDIPKFKKWVERYYQDITMMPAISDQDMTAMMTEESRVHQDEFNTTAALHELYKYVVKYNEELWQALEEDEFAKKNRLQFKLEQVRLAMDKEVYC
ncbi:plexin-A4-like isoform X2 [Mytilus californianus]|uniref:plexin-A4-like isoform X2 n=1 Tax=Mytilus californianus TaxID=6549 RepID=UPI00224853AF|nr:plexin-A4-like isoform X2 [Mytilus californianus]